MAEFNFDVIFMPDSEEERAERASHFTKGVLRRIQALEGEVARCIFNDEHAEADAKFTTLKHYRDMLKAFGADPRPFEAAQYLAKKQIEERAEVNAIVQDVMRAFSIEAEGGYKS